MQMKREVTHKKYMCVSLGNLSNIPANQQKILKNQSCLKLTLSMEKQYLLLFPCKRQLKCLFPLLFFSYFLYYYNIIYNKYIISNKKINKINLVIKNNQICITKCITKRMMFCKS